MNVQDLLAVITYWGACGVPGAPVDDGNLAGMPQTVQDCLDLCAPLGVGSPEYVECVEKCTNALQ